MRGWTGNGSPGSCGRAVALALLLVFLQGVFAGSIVEAQGRAGCITPLEYTVRPGDTLSVIAERFGTDVRTLASLNALANPDRLIAGQTLVMPCTLTAGDVAVLAALAGRGMGRALGEGTTPLPWAGVLTAREHLQKQLAVAGIPARVAWQPVRVQPGDVVAVRVAVGDRNGAVTAAVHAGENWYPLVGGDQGVLIGAVPLHGFVQPGMLYIRLRVNVIGGARTELKLPVWVQGGEFGLQHVTVPPAKAALLDPRVVQAEAKRLHAVWERDYGPPLWQGPFQWPIDTDQWPTTAPYGVRRSYNGGPVRSYHQGQDIAAPPGTPVYAPAQGRVVLAETLRVRGNAVVIDHGAGVMSNYWHLSGLKVAAGEDVQAGDLLGWVGTTGLSTGAHLHWEIRVHGVAVNPVPWTHVWGPAVWWGLR